jgi:hypothetical protein
MRISITRLRLANEEDELGVTEADTIWEKDAAL